MSKRPSLSAYSTQFARGYMFPAMKSSKRPSIFKGGYDAPVFRPAYNGGM
jgi:hypothetical protein